MEQDVIFFSKPWLPVMLYYFMGALAFIICYLLCCFFKRRLNTLRRFVFVIITTLCCAVHIIIGFYDVVNYHGYGQSLLRTYHLADYEMIRYGVIFFVTLNGILIFRL